MRGSIQRRGQRSWRISVELDRDPLTGRRRRIWVTVRGSKRDAEAKLAQLLLERETGIAVDPARVTVGEWLKEWLEQRRHVLRPTTFERYRAAVDGYLMPSLGRYRLQELRPVQIQAAYRRWLEGGLKATTVHSIHRVLAKALRDAVRLQLITRAATDATEPPAPKPRHPAVTAETLAAAVRSLDGAPQPWRALFLLILHTGLRRGEAAGLRWEDIDFERGVAKVVRTRTTTYRGEVVEGPPKTRSGERVVPLAPPVIRALREWRREQNARRLAAGPAWAGDDWVWATERGPIRPDSITLWWVQHAKRHGLGLRLHDLRHGVATLMAQSGVPPRVIAEVLGHARPSFTLDVYAQAPDLRAMRAALETITSALGE